MTYQDEYYDDYTDNYAVCEDEHALQEDIPTDTCCEPYSHVVRGREVQGAFAGLQVRQDLWDRQGRALE